MASLKLFGFDVNKIVLVILLFLVAWALYPEDSASSFTPGFLSEKYNPEKCTDENPNRVYPSGNVPASAFGLTSSERDNLLRNFMKSKGG